MIEVTLHATPRWSDAVLEQIRVVGLSLRREALVVAAVLGVGTFLVASDIVGGRPGFDSRETFPTALIAFFYPFLIWRNDRRFAPSFLWTLPVDRRRLALARVFAGFVWLMAAIAFFIIWLLTLGLLSGATSAHTISRIPFIATIGTYLFGSAVVLGLRHPLRWLLGAGGVMFLMGILSDWISRPDDSEWAYIPGAHTFFSTVRHALEVWLKLPASAQWAVTTFLWLAAGLAALWAAAARHAERRRP
ncbi:MAG TPA: hypothetical protein VGD79_11825 [Thermoanaerobaculia bacterium]|jgi:hypothetical protein